MINELENLKSIVKNAACEKVKTKSPNYKESKRAKKL